MHCVVSYYIVTGFRDGSIPIRYLGVKNTVLVRMADLMHAPLVTVDHTGLMTRHGPESGRRTIRTAVLTVICLVVTGVRSGAAYRSRRTESHEIHPNRWKEVGSTPMKVYRKRRQSVPVFGRLLVSG